SLGLGVAATKYVSQYRHSDPARAGRVIVLSSMVAMCASLAFAVALLVFAPTLSMKSFHTPSLASGLRWMAIYVFFTVASWYQTGALAGLEAFQQMAHLSAACGFVGLLMTGLLATLWHVTGAVVAFGSAALLLWTLQAWALRTELQRAGIPISYRGAW